MTKWLKRCLVLMFALANLAGAGAAEWRALFDGETLGGWWNPYAWGEVKVVGDEIHLTSDKKFFLLTERPYADFVFEGEVKLPEGKANSGFMFRCHQEPNRVWGYEAEVDPTERAWSGGLYDEGRRKWLNPVRDDAASIEKFYGVGNPLERTDWNRYRIICVGDEIKIEVNGVVTTEYRDDMDASGYIGLQHHGEDGQTYAFRNLRIQELDRDASEWKSLLNGADLSGWRGKDGAPAETGGWVFEDDGTLYLKGEGGDLYTEDEYENFELEFEWKVAPGANSGIKYRVAEYGGKTIGPEYQVLDDDKHPDAKVSEDRRAACLYDVVSANEAKLLNPVGEWNRSRVVADGTRLTHYLNGEKVVEADVSSKQWRSQISASKYKGIYEYGSKPGRILIQDHHDPVWYRNMRIRTF